MYFPMTLLNAKIPMVMVMEITQQAIMEMYSKMTLLNGQTLTVMVMEIITKLDR